MRLIRHVLAAVIVCGLSLSSCTRPTLPLSVQPETLNADWAVDWWLPRHTQKLLDKDTQTIDLIVLGDSITQGWETDGKAVWKQYFAPRNSFNLGFGGDRTENVLWRLDHGAVDGLSPKLLILMIGTNNTGHRMDKPEDTAAGIDAIIDRLAEHLPDTHILLLGIFPRGAQPDDPMRLRNMAINQLLLARAARHGWSHENVHYRDISSVFLSESGTLSAYIMPDLLHLSPEGYRLWAEAIEADVARFMAK